MRIFDEELVKLSQASSLIPGRPSVSTVWRWAMKGVRGVRLETVVIGNCRFTSRQAIQRMSDALTNGARPGGTMTADRTAFVAASKALDEEGI